MDCPRRQTSRIAAHLKANSERNICTHLGLSRSHQNFQLQRICIELSVQIKACIMMLLRNSSLGLTYKFVRTSGFNPNNKRYRSALFLREAVDMPSFRDLRAKSNQSSCLLAPWAVDACHCTLADDCAAPAVASEHNPTIVCPQRRKLLRRSRIIGWRMHLSKMAVAACNRICILSVSKLP